MGYENIRQYTSITLQKNFSKEHQKKLALTQKIFLKRAASLQRALRRVKQMHSVLSHESSLKKVEEIYLYDLTLTFTNKIQADMPLKC